MSRLHDRLIERYAEHYRRVKTEVDPGTLWSGDARGMDVMYRDLIAAVPRGGQVLDLGCGTGILLSWLGRQPGIIPVGIDASPSQVEVARASLPGTEVVLGDGLAYLRDNPETFAGIFCTDVLEHIPGDDLCLEWVEAARDALAPGGFFFCRMPNAANLAGGYGRHMDMTHQRSFTSVSILQLLDAAALSDCRVVPIRADYVLGRLRLAVEHGLHRAVFRICGYGLERVFTNNICAVGYKLRGLAGDPPLDPSAPRRGGSGAP